MTDVAVQKLLADLQTATETYRLDKREGAALAVISTLAFLELTEARHLTAPLLEALDTIRRNIEADDIYKSKVANIYGVPVSEIDRWDLSKEHLDKVMGCVAIEYQKLSGRSPEDAMRNVVGNDSAAEKSLAYFRHNIEYNDSPKGAWKCFEWMVEQLKEFPVSVMADLTIEMYRERIGTRAVKDSRFTKL
jgi:hypothetical protein